MTTILAAVLTLPSSDAFVPTERFGTIEIVRDTADDVQDRWIRLYIDDRPEEILRYGESLRVELAAGRHRVKAHNTLSSDTIDIDLARGQIVRIRCHHRVAKGGVLMMLTTGFAFITVTLEVVNRE